MAEMNAFSLLREDHERISGLFDLFMNASSLNEKLILFQQIKEDMELHSIIEEKVFYPALSRFYELTDLIDRSYEDHDEIEDLIEEVDQMEPDNGDFNDAVNELRGIFSRHVEEEERRVFIEARKLLSEDELSDMASEMNQLRSLRLAA